MLLGLEKNPPTDKLKNDGYDSTFFRNKRKNKQKTDQEENNKNILIMNFVNDRCTRRISKTIKKYNLPIRLVNKPAGPWFNAWVFRILKKNMQLVKSAPCLKRIKVVKINLLFTSSPL